MYHENQTKIFSKVMRKNNKRLKKQNKGQETCENIYMREAVLALIKSQNPIFHSKKHSQRQSTAGINDFTTTASSNVTGRLKKGVQIN